MFAQFRTRLSPERNTIGAAGAALIFSAAFALAACGGGGGGSPSTPVPPVTPPTTPTPVDGAGTVAVTPADGASAVKRDGATVTITATATAGTFASTTALGFSCNGTPVADLVKGTIAGTVFTIAPAATTLPNYGDVCVAQGQTVFTGKDGGKQTTVTWKTTFTIEKAPVTKLVYDDTIIGYWGITNGLPRKTLADGTQVTAVNKTKYASFLNCWPSTVPLANGLIPQSCAAMIGTDRYNDIVLNPVTMEMTDIPAPVVLTYVRLAQDSRTFTPVSKPTWSTAAKYTNGDYAFVDEATGSVVRRLTVAGTESVIYPGTFAVDNGCFLLMVYKNK